MALKTRLDSRSKENNQLQIVGGNGEVLATITLDDPNSVVLSIETVAGLHIAKPNGWSSK